MIEDFKTAFIAALEAAAPELRGKVVLDQMGYAATGRYLYPAICKHPELFEVVGAFRVPPTYLLRFDRKAAALKFGSE